MNGVYGENGVYSVCTVCTVYTVCTCLFHYSFISIRDQIPSDRNVDQTSLDDRPRGITIGPTLM